jgi:hypothetical protein
MPADNPGAAGDAGRPPRDSTAPGFDFGPEINPRERTAYHEAAHAVAARAFRLSVGPVTIEPGKSFSGTCFTGHPRSPFIAATGPTVLWPASLRKMHEAEAVIALAGDIGEELYDAERLARPAPRDEDVSVQTVRAVLERHTGKLPRAEAARLKEAKEREDEEREVSKDWEQALRAAEILAPDGVVALTPWLRHLTRELLVARWTQVQTVAMALLERGTLSKRELRALLADTKAR